MRQEERRARTRAALIEAATASIARDGYEGASLDALAATAGLSKGAVYAHFPSKIDLFVAVAEDTLVEATRRVERSAGALSGGADPSAAARRYLDERNGARHVGVMAEIWRIAVREESVLTRLEAYRSARKERLTNAAIDAGLPPADASRRAEVTARLIDAEILERRLTLASA